MKELLKLSEIKEVLGGNDSEEWKQFKIGLKKMIANQLDKLSETQANLLIRFNVLLEKK
jgi:hypothetical protein